MKYSLTWLSTGTDDVQTNTKNTVSPIQLAAVDVPMIGCNTEDITYKKTHTIMYVCRT